VVIIPVATAQSLFNRVSLFRIVVEAISEDAVGRAKEAILTIIRARHEGEDDITVITQDAILATFDRIFRALTMTVGGIAAISLVVAGIMIMNIMLVAVSNRRSEIGLLKALGAPPRQIMGVFLAESALLSIAGAAIGFLLAYGSMELLAGFFPEYSLALEPWSPFIASTLAIGTGIVFGVMPARRAALLEPAAALSRR
jgi:putative ABC transport system permease protein